MNYFVNDSGILFGSGTQLLLTENFNCIAQKCVYARTLHTLSHLVLSVVDLMRITSFTSIDRNPWYGYFLKGWLV